jgi:hypothetical protein
MKLTISFFISYWGYNQVFLHGMFAKPAKNGTFALPNRLKHFAKKQDGKEAPKFLSQLEIKIWKLRKK